MVEYMLWGTKIRDWVNRRDVLYNLVAIGDNVAILKNVESE